VSSILSVFHFCPIEAVATQGESPTPIYQDDELQILLIFPVSVWSKRSASASIIPRVLGSSHPIVV